MNLMPLTNTEDFLDKLEKRFKTNMHRHNGLSFDSIKPLLSDNILERIYYLEQTLGEPDIIEYKQGIYIVDMVKETPKQRLSLSYDKEARLSRTKYPPVSSILELSQEMNVEILDEEFYQYVQSIEELDLKTSSWLKTPESIRKLGGAIFGDRRYGRVFIYHNGADSYYSSRGFRAYIKIK